MQNRKKNQDHNKINTAPKYENRHKSYSHRQLPPPLLSRSVSVSVYLGVCLTLFLPVSLSLSDTSLAPTRVRKPAHLPRPSQTTPLLAFHAKATADDMLSLLHEKNNKKRYTAVGTVSFIFLIRVLRGISWLLLSIIEHLVWDMPCIYARSNLIYM